MSAPIPAIAPPPGQSSNFENPITESRRTHIALGISIPFITLFFVLRSYVRAWIKRAWSVEDWLALLAWAGTVAYLGVVASVMNHYGGRHTWDITKDQEREAAYWINVATIVYGVAICFTKLAVLWLYRRVFSPLRYGFFDLSIVSLIIIFSLFYGITTLAKIFQCIPRSKIYNKTLPGHCLNISAVLNASGLFNTITDFFVLCLPIKAVWALKLERKKKIIVVMVFTFGLCAPAFSLIGCVVRFRVSGNPDVDWNQPQIELWAAAELITGNVCVAFPEMAGLFKCIGRSRGRAGTGNLNYEHEMSRRSRNSHLRTQVTIGKSSSSHGYEDRYHEIKENQTYGVHVVPTYTKSVGRDQGGVRVTDEVIVESYAV